MPGLRKTSKRTTAKKATRKTTPRKKAAPPKAKAAKNGQPAAPKLIKLAPLRLGEFQIKIVGLPAGLLVNNKAATGLEVAEDYGGKGKASKPKRAKPSLDEMYRRAFYVMEESEHEAPHPKGDYGFPMSGVKKALCTAIRLTGTTDNTTHGVISRSLKIVPDDTKLCRIHHEGFVRDERLAGIGQGHKTPDMRHRPLFREWHMILTVQFNMTTLEEEAIVSLIQHAGMFVGFGEMRHEQKQGECGAFQIG
jgi:hypothetical protein